jgi:divalent metal cation (Fe/Co/Zn/Cd) transporter
VRPRETHLRRAVWLSGASIGWSAIVGSIAVYAALVSGSLSLLGFGGDAVLDAVVSVALVWRFVVEARQPERAARVERMAEGAVGLALIALAVYLVAASIRSLAERAHPEATVAGIALLVASVVVLPPLAIAKSRVAAALGSGALRADSILTGVAALLAAISELRSRGVSFEAYESPKTVDGIAQLGPNRGAWFKDPDGNIFALVERGSP